MNRLLITVTALSLMVATGNSVNLPETSYEGVVSFEPLEVVVDDYEEAGCDCIPAHRIERCIYESADRIACLEELLMVAGSNGMD